MSNLIQFPKTPIRALVIIPEGNPNSRIADLCEVRHGGLGHDVEPSRTRGSLNRLVRDLREECRGLPITVHPECVRRAAA